ncbi:MAG TPA: ribonuclease R [Thermoanaerobaculia bacterium]|nr:ribonuclease R [Thermoanaerobaculia bacterium]
MSTTFPGMEDLFDEKVLGRLDEAGKKGLAPDQIRRRLDLELTPDELTATLARLEKRGKALEGNGRWFAMWVTEDAGWIVGTAGLLESGDFIVRTPGRPGEGTALFVRRRDAKQAMEGDLVLARPMEYRNRKRPRAGDHTKWLPEGLVLKVLSQRHPTLVGALETGQSGRRWLAPFDPKMNLELQVVGAEGVPDGHYVVVEVERPGNEPSALGRVIEVLGHPDTPGADVLVVLRHHKIPEDFPTAVTEAAEAFPPDPGPEDWAGREDLRKLVTFTIDGAKSRDFDDAVSIERLQGGGFRLGVHIADVAHYVQEGTALDLEAYRRGTSVYYPERAVPMLPEGISNGLCSLRPKVPRLTMTVFIDFDRNGNVRGQRFAETVIQSARRLTYDEVRRLLLEPRETDAKRYGRVLPALQDMHELMRVLNRVRVKRGSIDFDLPEGDVQLDTDGVVVGVLATERNVAHRLIEEFMIAANEAVALELESHEVPALYRVHDSPSPDKLMELRELLADLGFQLKGKLQDLHPSALQKVLIDVHGHPEEAFVSSAVLRTMSRAIYSEECRGHYALASRYYTHFTSPIRRYPDLVVHRQLKSHLRGNAHAESERTRIAERLPAMGEHTSTTERRAEQSERDLLQWKKVRFLGSRIGEKFEGRITNVQPFGMFIQLLPYYVDGLLPVRSLLGDFFRYEPEGHRLVGDRTGTVYKIGDPIEVVLAGVNLRHRSLDLELPDQPKPEEVDGPWWLRTLYEPPPARPAGKRNSPATKPLPKKGAKKPHKKGTTRTKRRY